MPAPGDIAKSQQQPSRQHTTASPSGERSGSQQSSPDANALGTSAPSGSNTAENPFWFPPQYVPSGGEIQPDLRPHTHKDVWVFDAGLTPHRGRAVLDTGTSRPCVEWLSESVGNEGWQPYCLAPRNPDLQQPVVALGALILCCSTTMFIAVGFVTANETTWEVVSSGSCQRS